MSAANSSNNPQINFKSISELGNPNDYQAFDCTPKDFDGSNGKDLKTYKEINDYLVDDAIEMSNNNLTQTFVLSTGDEIIAYCTIFADSVDLSRNYRKKKVVLASGKIKSYPAISILYFGVNNNYQGSNYGKLLMIYMFEQIHQLSFFVGVTLIQVHALHSAAKFYNKQGFELYGENKQKILNR